LVFDFKVYIFAYKEKRCIFARSKARLLQIFVIQLIMDNPITLNNQTISSIENITGIKYDDIISMDSDCLTQKIQKKIGKKLRFKRINNNHLIGRGSVYIYLNRLFDFKIKKIDRYIDNIK